jgi:NADH-quinone oxidoreductase subunit G
MATIIINGDEYQLPDGEKINAIQAAGKFGVEIPYYCWHPSLSVVANCRMCEIEVGTKDPATGEIKMIPKLIPGCQTEAKNGTVIVTDSPKVKEHQRRIMEFLLINHPLDCPVCDQAGECGLQDYSYEHGQSSHRFVEERTVNPRKEVSELIQLNQDRCIMCTRCVRFTREIAGTAELQVIRRGGHGEIDIFPGHPVDNELAGNVVDLCPVGALLDKDFLHKQRAWYLTKHDSICTGCSSGCNITAEENKGKVYRFKPRQNPHVNDFWICDEGRYSYKSAHAPDLLPGTFLREGGRMVPAEPGEAVRQVAGRLKQVTGKLVAVLSPFLTVEEAYLLAGWVKGLNAANVVALGPVPVEGEDKTFAPDKVKGRSGDTTFLKPRPFTIRAEKAPNRRGVEAVLAHFQGGVIGFDAIRARLEKGEFQGAYFALGSPKDWIDKPTAEAIRSKVTYLAVQDSRISELAHLADAALASATYAEKAGHYANAEGRLQYSAAALPPREGTLPDLDIASRLSGRGEAPPNSREVLAEVAAAIPAFAAASGGVPATGLALEAPEPADSLNGDATFHDLWTLHRVERI